MSVIIGEDANLLAMYKASEDAQDTSQRSYLGMSAMGSDCDRELWLNFRRASATKFKAETLYNFADGHYSEEISAARLNQVPGIVLLTHAVDGNQFGFTDHYGHFAGHMDGKILGLNQAPNHAFLY